MLGMVSSQAYHGETLTGDPRGVARVKELKSYHRILWPDAYALYESKVEC